VSYHKGHPVSGVRFREDVGLELRCRYCKTYWPIDREWWDFRNFSRCKACTKKQKNALDRERYRRDPVARAKSREYQKHYRAIASKAKALYSHERYWENVEAERKKAMVYYHANREAILEKKRARYAQRKAA
jgi:hypothetical protein